MIIDTALEAAVNYEKKVRDVYLDAAKKSVDKVGRRLFSLMAEEEAGHVAYLERKRNEWVEKKKLSADDLKTAMAQASTYSKESQKLRKVLSDDVRDGELALLEKARELEAETSEFYGRLVSELPPEGQAFFKRFFEIEEGHLDIVQYQIDSLTNSGFWMGFPEFDMEARD